jgi:hypothetical protein
MRKRSTRKRLHPWAAAPALLALLAGGPAFAGPAHTAHTQEQPREALRVYTRNEAEIRQLALQFGHLKVDRQKGVVILEAPAGERLGLLAKGLFVAVDPVLSEALNAQPADLPGHQKGIAGYTCYRTVAETNARLDELVTGFPNLAQLLDIGPSWEASVGTGGERLRVLRLSNRDVLASKPVLFAMTAIHAREYTTAELNLRFAEYLLDGYGRDADATWILDHHEIQLLVHANPDGRKRAETGLSWRKNTNTGYCGAASSSRGADLNRNYPFAWSTVPAGSSGNPCSNTYRGPVPASEPETQAVVNHVRRVFADLRGPALSDPAPDSLEGLFLDIHSFSELVLWPWGMNTTLAPNSAALEQLGRRFAWFNGYTPQQSVGLYPTDGTTDDFAYGELGVPAYTFELGTAFFQSCGSFESTVYPDNLRALLYAAKTVRAPYRLPFGPEALQLRIEPDLAVTGEPIQLRAVLDDSRIAGAAGATSQSIAAAQAYLGAAPWQAGAQGQPMQASDGGFSSLNEAVEVEIAAAAPGRQLVYVQGSDSSGALGPVSAAFVDVRAANDVAQLSGQVSSRLDGSAVADAVVRVAGFSTQSGTDGSYARRVPAEATRIEVVAAGFEPLQLDDLRLQASVSNRRDLQLYSYCPRLRMDAENGVQAWDSVLEGSGGALWAIVAPGSVNSSNAWHDSPGGSYVNNLDTRLLSPAFDLSGYSSVRLRLRSFCDTESGFDYGQIDVRSGPAAAWVSVFSCSGDPNWRSLDLAVPQLDGAAAAQVRFRLTSDTAVVRDGWYVDDLVIEAGGAVCRALQLGVDVFADGFEGAN